MPEMPIVEKDKNDKRLFQYTFNGVTVGGFTSRRGASLSARPHVRRAELIEKSTSSDSVALS